MKIYFKDDLSKDILLQLHIVKVKNDYSAYNYLEGKLNKFRAWYVENDYNNLVIDAIEKATGEKIEEILERQI